MILFSKFETPDGIIDDVLSGEWYGNAYANTISDPDKEYLLPIIMYTDKTGTDAYQRWGMEPVEFTLAVFKREIRNLPSSWRKLGYVYDSSNLSKAERKKL